MKKNIVVIDFEFTGLHKGTTQVSLAMVSDNGHKFYAEFNDYDESQCDDWIQKNVIEKLKYKDFVHYYEVMEDGKELYLKNDKQTISNEVKQWLSQFKRVELWADWNVYDWVLFIDLLGMGKPMRQMPKNFAAYQAFDIATALKVNGIKPQNNRLDLLGIKSREFQHNALYDAEISLQIYEKFIKINKR